MARKIAAAAVLALLCTWLHAQTASPVKPTRSAAIP